MTLVAGFDILLTVLLVATIAYAVVLDRKLAALRGAEAEISALVSALAESAEKAGRGLASLKTHAEEQGQSLERTVDRARGLADDLTYLLERGTSLADRLDRAIGAARAAGPGQAADDPAPTGARPAAGQGAEPAVPPQQSKLFKALQGMR